MEKPETKILFARVHNMEINVSYVSLALFTLNTPSHNMSGFGIQPTVYLQPKVTDVAFRVFVAEGMPISFQYKQRH